MEVVGKVVMVEEEVVVVKELVLLVEDPVVQWGKNQGGSSAPSVKSSTHLPY
jgi:hypothetical protein